MENRSITNIMIRGAGLGFVATFLALQNRIGLVRATALTFIALPMLLALAVPVVALLGIPIVAGAVTQVTVEKLAASA